MTRKRKPVIFCVDTSRSMKSSDSALFGRTYLSIAKKTVHLILEYLRSLPFETSDTEVSLITFSTQVEITGAKNYILTDTDILPDSGADWQYKANRKSGSCLSDAIMKAISYITSNYGQTSQCSIDYLTPYLIFLTDGDADEMTDKDSFKNSLDALLKASCKPYILLIGDNLKKDCEERYNVLRTQMDNRLQLVKKAQNSEIQCVLDELGSIPDEIRPSIEVNPDKRGLLETD